MMLKYKIDKATYDALSDEQKAMYAEAGDGYQMQIEGLPDVTGLEAKVNELLGEKKSEAEKRRAAELAAQQAADEQARAAGDVTALENSWRQKLTDTEQRYQSQIDGLNGSLNTYLVDNVATTLAAKLSGEAAPVILPHIKTRLAVEMQDGKPVTRVLDASGKPSAMTIDELGAEFAGNKAFAGVIIGSRAQGIAGVDAATDWGKAKAASQGTGGNDLVSEAANIIKNMGIE
ncbi:hypothetical protein [Klebsiella aerogenes]|uniref:hypothetical protein n=1 Tax=Klebsiella aerogenes TaxID=548 RepID=UPI001E37CC12|nr:hypothetical protein [Klebsiella aerogenes]